MLLGFKFTHPTYTFNTTATMWRSFHCFRHPLSSFHEAYDEHVSRHTNPRSDCLIFLPVISPSKQCRRAKGKVEKSVAQWQFSFNTPSNKGGPIRGCIVCENQLTSYVDCLDNNESWAFAFRRTFSCNQHAYLLDKNSSLHYLTLAAERAFRKVFRVCHCFQAPSSVRFRVSGIVAVVEWYQNDTVS